MFCCIISSKILYGHMILFKNLNKRISVRRKYMCLSKEDLVELMEILPHLTSTAVTEKVLSVRKIYYNKRLWLNRQLSFEHWCLFYLTFYALLYEIMSLDFYINKVRILFIFLLKIRTAALPTVPYSSYSICFR